LRRLGRSLRKLCHDNTRGPQQTVVNSVTVFQNLNQAARSTPSARCSASRAGLGTDLCRLLFRRVDAPYM
jgi:hypothetical protein